MEPVFSPPQYHTYLLRCWQERSLESNETITVWRYSLSDPRTGRRWGFASLEALQAWLRTQLTEELS